MQFLMGPVDSSGRRDGGFMGPQVSNRQLLQTVGICCDIYSPVLVETPKDALRRKERLNGLGKRSALSVPHKLHLICQGHEAEKESEYVAM